MKPLILSFKERSKLALEILTKQSPVTLEQAKTQAKWLHENSSVRLRMEGTEVKDKVYGFQTVNSDEFTLSEIHELLRKEFQTLTYDDILEKMDLFNDPHSTSAICSKWTLWNCIIRLRPNHAEKPIRYEE